MPSRQNISFTDKEGPNLSGLQSNFIGSNIFGTMKICSRLG